MFGRPESSKYRSVGEVWGVAPDSAWHRSQSCQTASISYTEMCFFFRCAGFTFNNWWKTAHG